VQIWLARCFTSGDVFDFISLTTFQPKFFRDLWTFIVGTGLELDPKSHEPDVSLIAPIPSVAEKNAPGSSNFLNSASSRSSCGVLPMSTLVLRQLSCHVARQSITRPDALYFP
jgi:hypothetical protein